MICTRAGSPIPLPLLITGIAGVAGTGWFQARYPGQVIGIRQADNGGSPGRASSLATPKTRPGWRGSSSNTVFGSVLDCAGNCALWACQLDPALAWRTNVEGVRNLLARPTAASARWSTCRSISSTAAAAAATRRERIRPTPSRSTALTMVGRGTADPVGGAAGLDPADFAADGDQLQRPRRRDRLDPVAIPQVEARHALLRRDPLAVPTRIASMNFAKPCSPIDSSGPVSCRRASATEPVSDCADRQSGRRLRSRSLARLSADRGRPHPAPGRQCATLSMRG